MLEQYTLPEMGNIFSLENRYQLMTDVALTVCEAMSDIGQIPHDDYLLIKERAHVEPSRVEEIERRVHHNTLAFIFALSESVGPELERYFHMGVSNTDISDFATALQVTAASDLLHTKLDQLRDILHDLAIKYKYTYMAGRTHGTFTEPITFGLKMAAWVKEVDRCITRLYHARNSMSVGKINGLVGTYSSVDPSVELFVCRRLGLQRAEVSTQIIQRDRMGEYVTMLALVGSSLEKFATEIRTLQRTEIAEVEEAMDSMLGGSISLPNKRRPYRCELICGLARVLRGNSLTAMEDIVIWGEKDSSHSPAERVVLGDSCIMLDYMLALFCDIMESLSVDPERMSKNLDDNLGLVFSQRVLLSLMDQGVPRETAYNMVRRNAEEAWTQQGDFQYLLLQDEEVRKYLSRKQIMEMFDYHWFIRYIDYIFERAGIE